MLKRIFDFIFSLIGLIILSPFLIIIAILIKLEDGGPVFYRGKRMGRFGRLFKIFKFRSMVVNADKIGGPSTAGDDKRLTKVGKFLRKAKLDEIPQLINVLKGEMSFVGPRPEVEEYAKLYKGEEKDILNLRPGITDYASIWNSDEGSILAGAVDPEKVYLEEIRPKKVQLQLKYFKEKSFFTDIKIIFMTLAAIVRNCIKK